MAKRIYTTISIIYTFKVKKWFNFFILLIDIYLVGSSVKRRVFKILSGFRLYYSYYFSKLYYRQYCGRGKGILTILFLFKSNFYKLLQTFRLIKLAFINFCKLLGQLGANIYKGILNFSV